MITSNAFNYINVLDKAADASWTRESVISHNIANVDTPGYKRQDLDFESLLRQELSNYKYVSLDDKVNNLNDEMDRGWTSLKPTVFTDYAYYKYRLDGNNVDIDTEEVELASEQIKYQALTTSITQEFSRMRSVLT